MNRWDLATGGEGQVVLLSGEAGIGKWSQQELMLLLEIGMLPDGDFVGGGMAAVIDDNTSQLTLEDRRAIAKYLQSLPPQAGNTAE